MNGEKKFPDETPGMMARGYDNIVPMPGDGSYRCPRCGKVGNREDFGVGAEGTGAARCPECGRDIPF